jgi:hypothetical protein
MCLHWYKDLVHKHDLIKYNVTLYKTVKYSITYVRNDFQKIQGYIRNKIHHYLEYIDHYYRKDY